MKADREQRFPLLLIIVGVEEILRIRFHSFNFIKKSICSNFSKEKVRVPKRDNQNSAYFFQFCKSGVSFIEAYILDIRFNVFDRNLLG